MKSMIDEFKAFINKGNVVTIAVGLVMALYFTDIVNAVIDGLILPIVAAIMGEPNYAQVGFTINGADFSVGLVIEALVKFVAVAFILFLIVKAYNAWKGDDEDDAGPTEVELLTEIRDVLRNR